MRFHAGGAEGELSVITRVGRMLPHLESQMRAWRAFPHGRVVCVPVRVEKKLTVFERDFVLQEKLLQFIDSEIAEDFAMPVECRSFVLC